MSDTPGATIINWIFGAGSTGVVAATIVGWLPPIAAAIAFVWYCIQIYESQTVQRWNQRRLRKRLIRLHQDAGALEMRLLDMTDTSTRTHFKAATAMRVDMDAGLQGKSGDVKPLEIKKPDAHEVGG